MKVRTKEYLECYGCKIPVGSKGTVIGENFTGNPIVEFDNHIGGHNGIPFGRGKSGHCWIMWESNLEEI